MGEYVEGKLSVGGFPLDELPRVGRLPPVSKTLMALSAINSARRAMDEGTPENPKPPLTPQERQNLLKLIPPDFLETNPDDFMVATFVILNAQNNAGRLQSFNEILDCPAMMQATPAQCARVIERLLYRLPLDCRSERADFILKGDFGKIVARTAPSSYAQLVSTLAEDVPNLLDKRPIATFETERKTARGQIVMDQHTLSAVFIKPALGLPPLLEKSYTAATRFSSLTLKYIAVWPVNQEHIEKLPKDAQAAVFAALERQAKDLARPYPRAAAAILDSRNSLNL